VLAVAAGGLLGATGSVDAGDDGAGGVLAGSVDDRGLDDPVGPGVGVVVAPVVGAGLDVLVVGLGAGEDALADGFGATYATPAFVSPPPCCATAAGAAGAVVPAVCCATVAAGALRFVAAEIATPVTAAASAAAQTASTVGKR
jgi:hypothetical protein